MRYRVSDNIKLPFRLIPAIQEEGKSKVTFNVKVTAQFDPDKSATDVVVKVPVSELSRVVLRALKPPAGLVRRRKAAALQRPT